MRFQKAVPVNLGGNKPMYLPLELNFVGRQNVQENIDLEVTGLYSVNSIFVDNANNPWGVVIEIGSTGQVIIVPPYSQYVSPVYQAGVTCLLSAYSEGQTLVQVILYNFIQDTQRTFTYDSKPTTYVQYNLASYVITGNGALIVPRSGSRYMLFIHNDISATTNISVGLSDDINPALVKYYITIKPSDFFFFRSPFPTENIFVKGTDLAHKGAVYVENI